MAKYNKAVRELIYSLYVKNEYSINEICKKADISKETFFDWKKHKPDFSDHLQYLDEVIRDNIVIKAKLSLEKLITGYSVDESKAEIVYEKIPGTTEMRPIVKSRTKTTKHIQPNAGLIQYYLNNSDPKNFKTSTKVDVTSNGETIGFHSFLMKTKPAGVDVKQHSETEIETAAEVYTPDHRD